MGFKSKQRFGDICSIKRICNADFRQPNVKILVKFQCLKCLCFVGTEDFVRCLNGVYLAFIFLHSLETLIFEKHMFWIRAVKLSEAEYWRSGLILALKLLCIIGVKYRTTQFNKVTDLLMTGPTPGSHSTYTTLFKEVVNFF